MNVKDLFLLDPSVLVGLKIFWTLLRKVFWICVSVLIAIKVINKTDKSDKSHNGKGKLGEFERGF